MKAKKKPICLISENLSHLGGMMGTEYTTEHVVDNFNSVEEAKAAAEKEYRKKINWSQKKGPTRNFVPIDITCSGDLGYVMYHIRGEIK